MRLVAALSASLLLTACNIVQTTTPLFTKADEAGAPQLRSGVWRGTDDDGKCAVDESLPLKQWPDCAGRGIAKGGQLLSLDQKDGKWTWSAIDYVLAAGDPRVLQVHITPDTPAAAGKPGFYGYAGLQTLKSDERGRITAFRVWPVLCGPPPPPARPGQTPRFGTREPLPGMVMDKERVDCTTSSPSALRAAAAASRKWSDSTSDAHWVRDGED